MEAPKVVTPTSDQIAALLADHKLWLLDSSKGKRANLSYADLSYADLRSADLSSADLSSANLSYADLSSADLSSANLRSANLSSADLSSADLSSADLRYADLTEAKEAELVLARTEILPREGSVVGWKKCRNKVLVKLLVPHEAKRSNALGRKCRAEFVDVLEVIGAESGVSLHDSTVIYRIHETVHAHIWEPNRHVECGGGIHFYLTKEEAQAHGQ